MATQELNEPAGGTFPATSEFNNDGDSLIIHYVNNLDVQADYTVSGTYQGDDFTDAATLDSASVSTGTTDFFEVTGAWDKIQVSVDATTPSTGTAEAYRHEARIDR